MVSQGNTVAGYTSASLAREELAREELVREIECRTNRQVRDLAVDLRGARVRVTGLSRTYYVKQLVTQAILTAAPRVQLDNEIEVCRN